MRLTPREKQVALLVAATKTDRDIALVLELSFHTVRDYVKAIFRKLQVHKRTAVSAALAKEIW